MNEKLTLLKEDKLLKELAEIYVENCGLSLGERTIAHYLAIPYIAQTYNIDMHDAVDLFDLIMDDIDPEHRNYDIALITSEEFDEYRNDFIEGYDELAQYADILKKIK